MAEGAASVEVRAGQGSFMLMKEHLVRVGRKGLDHEGSDSFIIGQVRVRMVFFFFFWGK